MKRLFNGDYANRNAVALIGNFGAQSVVTGGGQTIRTALLGQELRKRIGGDKVLAVDTAYLSSQPLRTLGKIRDVFQRCKNIIIMPADRGLRWLLPFYLFFARRYDCQIHYVVVGGWLPDFLEDSSFILKGLRNVTGIYVQSQRMKARLAELGLANAHYLPNFRDFEPVAPSTDEWAEPLALVFLSRVIPAKGVALCVEVVRKINAVAGYTRLTLDLWGPVPDQHQTWFRELLPNAEPAIHYRGILPPDQVIATLAGYDALIFPTWYDGEGFPGVVVDAYAAGIPVIASDWHDNCEVVNDGETGLIVRAHDEAHLHERLTWLLEHPLELMRMKAAAAARAGQYHVDKVIPPLLQQMGLCYR